MKGSVKRHQMVRQFAFLNQCVHWSSELAVSLLPNGEVTHKRDRGTMVFCFGDGLLWRQREIAGNT